MNAARFDGGFGGFVPVARVPTRVSRDAGTESETVGAASELALKHDASRDPCRQRDKRSSPPLAGAAGTIVPKPVLVVWLGLTTAPGAAGDGDPPQPPSVNALKTTTAAAPARIALFCVNALPARSSTLAVLGP